MINRQYIYSIALLALILMATFSIPTAQANDQVSPGCFRSKVDAAEKTISNTNDWIQIGSRTLLYMGKKKIGITTPPNTLGFFFKPPYGDRTLGLLPGDRYNGQGVGFYCEPVPANSLYTSNPTTHAPYCAATFEQIASWFKSDVNHWFKGPNDWAKVYRGPQRSFVVPRHYYAVSGSTIYIQGYIVKGGTGIGITFQCVRNSLNTSGLLPPLLGDPRD